MRPHLRTRAPQQVRRDRDDYTSRPHRDPRRRLAARNDRIPCRRRVCTCDSTDQCLADPVRDFSGTDLACRRFSSGALNAALAGWCFGFGYFLAGLYWIGYAFLVDVKTFGWLLPIAVAGLPACLALYTALGLGVARLIWLRGPERLLAFAAAMTASEWLRGHLLSGFPWNTFGYALTQPLVLAQSVSLVG